MARRRILHVTTAAPVTKDEGVFALRMKRLGLFVSSEYGLIFSASRQTKMPDDF